MKMFDNPEAQERYLRAAHAMQSGVAAQIGIDPGASGTSPKSLRVGVNSAMVQTSAILDLLVDKGLVTAKEAEDAIIKGMETEVERYKQELAKATGAEINLA